MYKKYVTPKGKVDFMNDNIDRSRIIVKDNELIQKARYDLTVNQQKIIAYIISLIKPTDQELQKYEISISDFCELCGINKSKFYTEIKVIVDNMDSKSFWVETEEKIFKFRWFSEVEIIKGSGKVNIQLNSNIKKYLIGLSESFTQYELYNILALKSKYSIRLYEWFKSYSFLREKQVDLAELKYILEAEKYIDFKSFRRRVIDPAITEINQYTDLEVAYSKVTKSKTVTGLIFNIRFKEIMERYGSYLQTIEEINQRSGQIKGQIGLFDKSENDFL